jgi:hypothetical protein
MDQPEAATHNPTTQSILFFRLRDHLPQLEELYRRIDDGWIYEDHVYRFYHQSFKVYKIQPYTVEIVEALQALAPDATLNPFFLEIYQRGIGHTFEWCHNENWLERARPMVEAFFHAKFMLEMAVRHGRKFREQDTAPQLLESGWAAFLYFFNLR